MKQYNEILEKVLNITNTMNKTSKCPRDFGVGVPLYPSEIHTIEAIGAHEPINAKALAQALGITNGAVTQIADKLQKKGLVEKFKIDGNQKTVYIKLTALGRTSERKRIYCFHSFHMVYLSQRIFLSGKGYLYEKDINWSYWWYFGSYSKCGFSVLCT